MYLKYYLKYVYFKILPITAYYNQLGYRKVRLRLSLSEVCRVSSTWFWP